MKLNLIAAFVALVAIAVNAAPVLESETSAMLSEESALSDAFKQIAAAGPEAAKSASQLQSRQRRSPRDLICESYFNTHSSCRNRFVQAQVTAYYQLKAGRERDANNTLIAALDVAKSCKPTLQKLAVCCYYLDEIPACNRELETESENMSKTLVQLAADSFPVFLRLAQIFVDISKNSPA